MRRLILAAGLLLIAGLSAAGAQTLAVAGISERSASLDVAALEALGVTEISDTREVSGQGAPQRLTIVYRGVELAKVLEAQGIGEVDRYRIRAATVLITAKDGYRASFSWGEVFNSVAGPRILVITSENGRPNSAREGVFSLRSLSDLRPGPRHVRDVAEIRLILPP
ncbi:MAG: hypothetical protein QM722_01275 [Piscinibacter sp.]